MSRTTPIILHENGQLGFEFENEGAGANMTATVVLIFYPVYDLAYRNPQISG